ncbi:hypothetical protein DNTS_001820, partial [Danionella cerebrum]
RNISLMQDLDSRTEKKTEINELGSENMAKVWHLKSQKLESGSQGSSEETIKDQIKTPQAEKAEYGPNISESLLTMQPLDFLDMPVDPN